LVRSSRDDKASEWAQTLAIEALGFLAADMERLEPFLSLTGIDPSNLRGVAAQPSFLVAVLDHLAGDESLLSATNSLQGLAYSTRLSGNYVLGSDIAASGTSTWNSNSGFSPIGDATTNFTGTFDGLGHTITGLTINRSQVILEQPIKSLGLTTVRVVLHPIFYVQTL
jgi:hypothetical protein